MDLDEIYVKTEQGQAELRERKLGLSVPLRSLLILIDGQRSVAQVLAKAQALPLDPSSFTALENSGLIAKKFEPALSAGGATVTRSEDDVQRFLVAQKALSDAIGNHLGLRGYGLMLRLQRANSLRELHEMLPEFARMLVKRIGMDAATPIVTAIEQQVAPRRV